MKSLLKTAVIFLLSLVCGCGFQRAGRIPEIQGYDSFFVENQVGIQQLIDQPVAGKFKAI